MIEKYFMTGVRLKWACPGADASGSKDGSIVNSPPVNASPMIYDGLDGGLKDMGNPHTSTVGLTMRMSIPYAWLAYKLGHTAKRLLMAGDVLTGPMSGCAIAEWTERGQRWVGHVGTVTDAAAINKKVKENFGIAMPTQARGFYPAAAWPPKDVAPLMMQLDMKRGPRDRIIALVTTSCEFYAILMFEFLAGTRNEWCVGGIKRIPPMNATQLRSSLLS